MSRRQRVGWWVRVGALVALAAGVIGFDAWADQSIIESPSLVVTLRERVGDPVAQGNIGKVYTKDSGGITSLYFEDDAGTVHPLVAGGVPPAPANATYITQTANGTLSAEQAMSTLGTGLVKNTTGTGVQSIGIVNTDYFAPSAVILGVDGAVGAPAFSFATDPNTGSYSGGADTIAWTTGGTQRMTLAATGLACDVHSALTAVPATLRGGPADGATAVGVALDTAVAYSMTGSVIADFRNAGASKLSVGWDGTLGFPGSGAVASNKLTQTSNTLTFWTAGVATLLLQSGSVYSPQYSAYSAGDTAKVRGRASDGANTAVAVDNVPTLTNTGAKLLSVRNNTVEKAYVGILGGYYCTVAGCGLHLKEGTDAMMGTCVLAAGACTVLTTAVTASSRIFLTGQADGGTPGWLRVTARTAATSFGITSSNAADTSTVAWMIVEPAP